MLLPNKVKWHVIHLLVQRRVLIFLASSSGFKGFWKPSFLKAKPFLGVNLFYEIFFGPATTPSRLFLFVFLVSPVTGSSRLEMLTDCMIKFYIRVEDLRTGSWPFHFSFALWKRSGATQTCCLKLVQGCPGCCFCCHSSGETLWNWSVFILSHLSIMLCFCFLFMFVFSCRPWQQL